MAEKEENVLVAQIDALTQNLKRIEALLRNEAIGGEYRNPIYGKFAVAISPRMRQLDQLKQRVQGEELTQDQLAEAWEEYASVKQEGQRVFAQCLDFLGGIAVRKMGLEEGICDLAERLVRHYAGETGVSWSSVMILGEDRLFDTVSRITQIIRMRFPEWDIWSLPFTAHEFGQLVASSEAVSELREFFVDEERHIRRLIEDQNVTDEELEGVAQDILALREKYVGSSNAEAVKRFLEQQRIHMRSLFADVFATYFMGPAYLHARLYLRLIPTEVFQDRPDKPSLARRTAFMLGTLEKMNEAEKTSKFDDGPYHSILNRLKTVWEETVQAVHPAYQGGFHFGKPYDDWFPKVYTKLQTQYGLVGFKRDHWTQANEIGKQLLDSPQIAPGTPLVVILNAAWVCRTGHPNRLVDIAKQVCLLFEQAAAPLPGGPPTQR